MSEVCNLCPRHCGADRGAGKTGYCRVTSGIKIARAALHFWEEPCISGEDGSGTVFFCGCTLGCVYCQNQEISRGVAGKYISSERLSEIFLELQEKKANNINLVTPDHYAPQIAEAVVRARKNGLRIPVVANTGGYVSDEIYDALAPVTDIWLADYKYSSPELARKYSKAGDYPEVARKALKRMFRDTGKPVYNEDDMLLKGIIVRLLLLPGCVEDAKRSVKYLYEEYGDDIILSLMNQYTPPSSLLKDYPEIDRSVTREEYDELIDYAVDLGVENAFTQEDGTDSASFIPPFDLEGVEKP